jgi:hypothetical protein
MKKNLLLALIPVLLGSCFTTNTYRPTDFDNKTSNIKTIAILPFKVTTIGYPPRHISQADIDINNEKRSYSLQESLYNYLVFTNAKKKQSNIREFQPLQKTIALLKQNNISLTNIYEKQPEEIAKILGVDAVVITNAEEYKNWNENVLYKNLRTENAIENKTFESAKINCYIYSGNTGDIVWQTSCSGDGRGMINPAELMDFLTLKIGNNFPFNG